MLVLVVEDDIPTRRLVCDGLKQKGIDVAEAGSVAGAIDALGNTAFDVVILDLTLADGSGVDVLDHLRETSPGSHVIVLSAAVTELDRVRALELGADDYVAKPFYARELVARVHAVQRRRGQVTESVLRVGALEIDLVGRNALFHGAPLHLTAKEFALLAFLAARPGHVFSRADLLRAVWQSAPTSPKTVAEHIRRLRTKIEDDPRHPELLLTVRGAGYRFDLPAPTDPRAAAHIWPDEVGVIMSVDGVIVSADAAAVALVGVSEDDMGGRSVIDFMAPSSVHAAEERMRVSATGPEPRSQVLLLVHRDGEEIPVEFRTSLAVWDGQPAIRAELRHAAEESARLRHLVTGVLSDVAEAVVVTDMHFHIRSWNGGAERLYGWLEPEVLGRHILDVVAWSDDFGLLKSAWERLLETDRWHGIGRQRARDGAEIVVRASTNVVRDDSGSPVGIVSVNRPLREPASDLTSGAGAADAADLRRGLDDGELDVFYQPVVMLEDSSIVTVEALVRWHHPDLGLVSPAGFIETAERSGLILELGAFVLRVACEQTAAWRRAGADINLAVNLSARELTDPLLVERIAATLAASRLDPTALWLEVTETALVEDVEQASVRLHALAALGIGISIDDFGTGWASLTYLRRFPVHVLKIDRSFVSGVDQDPSSAAIVRSILSLGAELGLAVVAEGVETEAEAATLRELGCSIGQGYLYGRPTPAADVDVSRMYRIGGDPPTMIRDPDTGTGAVVAAAVVDGPESEAAEAMLRGLLHIRSAADAAELLQRAVRQLGGAVVLASAADSHALPIDVSLGEGPPLLARAEHGNVARTQIERTIPRLLEDARQAIDLLRRHERLGTESNHDPLTGLHNRRVLDRVLSGAGDGVLLMIDLDRFKGVNDTFGHAAGDAVIVAFGDLLAQTVRVGDLCCRVGGEEFVVIAPGLDVDGGLALVERMRLAWVDAAPRPVTFSVGVAPVSSLRGTPALLAADRALFRAKTLGRDRTEVEAA